ncbi:MAG TPA: hypothetical protein VEY70_13340 [Metabacillus sp.]|nr:hypothetical protein [Metabacillus sp.]
MKKEPRIINQPEALEKDLLKYSRVIILYGAINGATNRLKHKL